MATYPAQALQRILEQNMIRRTSVGLVAAGLLLMTACTSSGGEASSSKVADESDETTTTETTVVEVSSSSAFCANVKEFAELSMGGLSDIEADVDSGRKSSISYLDALGRFIELFAEVPESAPDALQAEMRNITSISPDSIVLEDIERREEAVATIDEVVRRDCGIAYSFEDVNFDDSSPG